MERGKTLDFPSIIRRATQVLIKLYTLHPTTSTLHPKSDNQIDRLCALNPKP